MSTRKSLKQEEAKSAGESSSFSRAATSRSSSLDRLSSLRPKRDLTLGGVPKKTFAPTIPAERRVKKKTEPVEPSAGSEGGRRGRGGRGAKRGGGGRERKGREVITSASVFSMGPAEVKRSTRKHEPVETFSGASIARPKKMEQPGPMQSDAAADNTQDPEDDDEEVVMAGQGVAELFPVSQVPPVQLPLDPSTLHDPHRPPSLKTTAAQLFTASEPEKGKFLFFQLPDCLPVSTPQAEEQCQDVGSAALRTVPEGLVGRLVVHKSGRVRLILGDTALNVSMGTSCGFLQELVCVYPEERRLTILGQLSHRLVCAPDVDSALLLEQTV